LPNRAELASNPYSDLNAVSGSTRAARRAGINDAAAPPSTMSAIVAATLAASSGIVFVSNKVLLLAVVAVLGKPGFQQLKRHVFGYVAMLAPSPKVGRLRHSIGLVMFALPLFTTFLEPYDDYIWPELLTHSWKVELLSDLIFIVSFFILGGDFWDKIRALFVRTAQVVDLGDDTAAPSPALIAAASR